MAHEVERCMLLRVRIRHELEHTWAASSCTVTVFAMFNGALREKKGGAEHIKALENQQKRKAGDFTLAWVTIPDIYRYLTYSSMSPVNGVRQDHT